jgi:hypothetical protein
VRCAHAPLVRHSRPTLDRMKTPAAEYSAVFDAIVSAFLVALAACLAMAEPTPAISKAALSLSFFLYLAALFVCAYVRPNALLVFRGLMAVCLCFSWPRRREMALVYAAMFCLAASVQVFQGIG